MGPEETNRDSATESQPTPEEANRDSATESQPIPESNSVTAYLPTSEERIANAMRHIEIEVQRYITRQRRSQYTPRGVPDITLRRQFYERELDRTLRGLGLTHRERRRIEDELSS